MSSETIRVRRGGGFDHMGDARPTQVVGTYHGCAVYPRRSGEGRFDASTVIVGMGVIVPDPGADITAQDEIEWARQPEVWYRVEGQPGPWFYGDGSPAGLEIALTRGTG